MPSKSAITAYLSRYAEPESATLEPPQTPRRYVLVIPAFDEPEDFVWRLLPEDARDVAIIVIANVPAGLASDDPRTRRTEKLLAAGPYVRDTARQIDVITIDRTRPSGRIPRRQGVGLARKLGADTALWWIHRGQIAEPVIYNTDADACLPARYFDACTKSAGPSAWLYPFYHHSADANLMTRATHYELHLRYYVDQLRQAGSAYAFHTLGSTIAVSASAYAAVRGYPKRNAAEDFYLLNKLAKVGPLEVLPAPTIKLAARLSERVPFGTGPALTKMPANPKRFTSYAPESFALLARCMALIGSDQGGISQRPACGAQDRSDDLLTGILHEIGYRANPRQSLRQRLEWFDAFRTVKFMHAARQHYPDRPVRQTIAELYGSGHEDAETLNQLLIGVERQHAGPRGPSLYAGR